MASSGFFLALYPLLGTEREAEKNRDIYTTGNNEELADGLDDAGDGFAPRGDAEDPVPGQTPPPESFSAEADWRDQKHFRFTWGDKRLNRLGIFLGGSAKMCDLAIPHTQTFFKGVSAVQGLFSFDEQYRLTYCDIRNPDEAGDGSAVLFDGHGGEKRRGFTWVLSDTAYIDQEVDEIVLQVHGRLRFRVYVPPHDYQSQAYRAKVDAFRSIHPSQDPEAAQLVEGLCVRPMAFHLPTTVLPTGAHTLAREPIFIETLKPLGCGTFGMVKRLYNVTQGQYIARKEPVGSLTTGRRRLWEREIALLERIREVRCCKRWQRHSRTPNTPEHTWTLMRTIQASDRSVSGSDFGRYVVQLVHGALLPNPVIDLEYAACGSLYDQHARCPLDTIEVASVLKQVLKALVLLHGAELAIAHRDIKPANVLVLQRARVDSHEGRSISVKLADFGLAKDHDLATMLQGTLRYMAPELYPTKTQLGRQTRQPYTTAVDLWAVGVMAYELVHGYPRTAQAPRRHKDGVSDVVADGLAMCRAVMAAAKLRRSRSATAAFAARHMLLWEPQERRSAQVCLDLIDTELPVGDGENEAAAEAVTPRPGSPTLPLPRKHALHGSNATDDDGEDDLEAPSRSRPRTSLSSTSHHITVGDEDENDDADEDGDEDNQNEDEDHEYVARPSPSPLDCLQLQLEGGQDGQVTFAWGDSSEREPRSHFSMQPADDDTSGWPTWNDDRPDNRSSTGEDRNQKQKQTQTALERAPTQVWAPLLADTAIAPVAITTESAERNVLRLQG